jgi:hypothetical protein
MKETPRRRIMITSSMKETPSRRITITSFMKETPRRRITITSSIKEISTYQLGYIYIYIFFGGDIGEAFPRPPLTLCTVGFWTDI